MARAHRCCTHVSWGHPRCVMRTLLVPLMFSIKSFLKARVRFCRRPRWRCSTAHSTVYKPSKLGQKAVQGVNFTRPSGWPHHHQDGIAAYQ